MALSFAFDPSKGETPQTIAQRRQMSNLIAAQMLGRAPKNVGEGLNAIGQALIARSMMGEADSAQKAGEASLPDFLKSQITGQPVTPTAPTYPTAAATPPMGNTTIPAGNAEFVNTIMPLAQSASEKTGIDPRLITAQAALETGYGKSAPGNNLFGIKSHGQPGGNVLPTTEIVNGQPVRTNDSFMSYASPEDSANSYADFINKNPRYAPLKAASGLEAQAAALGQSGYATDPNYGQKVLQIAQGLPAPTGGVLADNSPSPLDNAQYPVGPVGAATAPAGESPAPAGNAAMAAIPSPAQTAQGVPPTTQVAPPVAQPQNRFLFKNASDEDLQKALINPFTPENVRTALTQEYKMRAEAAQKAADPMRALDMQSKTLAVKKAQQDLDNPDKLKIVKIGQDSLGREQYGIFNPSSGEIKPYTPPNGGAPDPLGNTNLTGKDYLATLPKEQANTVQLMVEGKIPPPTSFAMSKPYWQNMISAAKNYDPTFDATAWAGRVAGTRDFSAGKSAEMVRSANQTLHHVGALLDSMDNLKNGQYPILNSIGNTVAEARGSGAQGAFRTNAHAVAEELSKVFKGNNLSDAEIKSWEQNLHENMSPEQQRTQIAKLSELLQGSLHALEEKRTASIGPIAAEKSGPIIKDEGQRVLERINKWVNGDRSSGAIQEKPQGKTSSGVSWSIQ